MLVVPTKTADLFPEFDETMVTNFNVLLVNVVFRIVLRW